jgi:hypothetical protein
MHKFFAAILFAVSALASPAPDTSSAIGTSDSPANHDLGSISSYAAGLEVAIPSSILTVMETAIPASWQDEVITDPAFRSSVASAAAAGTYPAWYNELPSSVKAWASSNFDAQVLGVPSTTKNVASETGSTGTQSVSNAVQTTSSGSSAAATSVSSSRSGSGSSSVSASASPAKSTGGASLPTSGAIMGVAGVAGVLSLAVML